MNPELFLKGFYGVSADGDIVYEVGFNEEAARQIRAGLRVLVERGECTQEEADGVLAALDAGLEAGKRGK